MAAILPQPVARAADSCAQKYTVVAGDTLSKIADQYKVTVQEVAAANNLKDPYPLYVGQSLCIPGTTAAATTTTTETKSKSGITLSRSENGTLTVKVSELTKKASFVVKVGSGRFRVSTWYKVGLLRTSKTGTASKSFRLPKSLRQDQYLIVCLKNVATDATFCQRFNANQ